ncbi:MAG: insulinase family protein [Candidatus Nanoarchaeia archaeon]|nr:insulinase family protein [Candidatus Nanoarchaeia archaeon]
MDNFNGQFNVVKLENGLTFAYRNTDTQAIKGKFRIMSGISNEDSGEQGLSYLLERTIASSTPFDLSEDEENSLRFAYGTLKSLVSFDKTEYKLGFTPRETQSFLRYISSKIFNQDFSDKELINSEKSKVLKYMKMKKRDPLFIDELKFDEAFYGKESPFLKIDFGDEYVISSTNQEQLRDFHSRKYVGNNSQLILVGNLPKNIEDIVNESFSFISSGKSTQKCNFDLKNFSKKELKSLAPELLNPCNPVSSIAQLRLGIPFSNKFDRDYLISSIIKEILIRDDIPVSKKDLLERNKKIYNLNFQSESLCKGRIVLNSNITAFHANDSINYIFDEMRKIQEEPITEETLELLKRRSQFSFSNIFDSIDGKISAIELSLDDKVRIGNINEEIDSITINDFKKCTEKYLPNKRLDEKSVLLLRTPFQH